MDKPAGVKLGNKASDGGSRAECEASCRYISGQTAKHLAPEWERQAEGEPLAKGQMEGDIGLSPGTELYWD